MGLLGVVSILLGGAFLANPIIGVAVLPFFIGITELVGGLGAIFVAFSLRAASAR